MTFQFDLDIILKYFPELTGRQIQQFEGLGALYQEWNERINVISRKDIDHLYEKHVLHSLGIAKAISFQAGIEILDVGTGGGFPGIPLAILFPESRFCLVDSIGKKIKVVNEVASAVGLGNVTAVHARAEEIGGKFEFIISRAVTRLSILINWTRKMVTKQARHPIANGLLCLKGGDLSIELADVSAPMEQFNLSDYFEEPFFETKRVVHVAL